MHKNEYIQRGAGQLSLDKRAIVSEREQAHQILYGYTQAHVLAQRSINHCMVTPKHICLYSAALIIRHPASRVRMCALRNRPVGTVPQCVRPVLRQTHWRFWFKDAVADISQKQRSGSFASFHFLSIWDLSFVYLGQCHAPSFVQPSA